MPEILIPTRLTAPSAPSSGKVEIFVDEVSRKISSIDQDGTVIQYSGTGAGPIDHAGLSNLDFASSGHTGFEPAKGTDDNYVTDAEKIILSNTSGTNTGDIQVSATPPVTPTLNMLWCDIS